MKIWVVGITDCEGGSVVAVCATKQVAERELFKARDELIVEWKRMKIFAEKSEKEFVEEQAKRGIHVGGFIMDKENTYDRMIKNLSSNDYKNWNNYPQDCPYLYETDLIEKEL